MIKMLQNHLHIIYMHKYTPMRFGTSIQAHLLHNKLNVMNFSSQNQQCIQDKRSMMKVCN